MAEAVSDPLIWIILLGPTAALLGLVSFYDWRKR